MPDTNKASHTVLAPALAAPADHQHQELLDEPKALSATAEMSPALFAREAGGSNNSPSSADSDGLDPETFNFSPFIRDRQGPADIRGQLTTREELFSSILRPLPLAFPRAYAATTGTSARTDINTSPAAVDVANGEVFGAQKRDVSERVDSWFTEFEDMCIRSKRMEDELEPLVALASERVEQATGVMLECIEQCERAWDAAIGEHGRLVGARSRAGQALNGCVEDFLELRQDLDLVRTAARTFPTGVRGPVVLFATTKTQLKRYFEAVHVPFPAILMAQERAGDD
ncbi:hypothetical protein SLS64_003529 [Diaporthe eres]|uniref:Component of oligomeric Golgi complex 3 n=1 Tax=Diaporthe eres TaxID=83184 RepID=A0ABR1PCJ5_DIAER